MTALLRAVAGLSGWAIGFSLLYGVHGLGCARGWSVVPAGPTDALRLALLLTWIGSSAAIAAWTLVVFRSSTPPATPLLAWLAQASAVTGLVAMLVSGLPVAMTRLCDAPPQATAQLPTGGTPVAGACSGRGEACRRAGAAVSATASRKAEPMSFPIARSAFG